MSERPSFEPSEAKDFKIYDRPDEKPGYDKGSHKLRSEATLGACEILNLLED